MKIADDTTALSTTQLLERMRRLPARPGPAPNMTPRNPQEQLDQFPADWRLVEALADFAFSLPGVREGATKVAPDGARALFLVPGVKANEDAFLVDREFAHIHRAPTGSMHMTLPQPFRYAALMKGWILRHPFAIVERGPVDAVFVFAPRDEEELSWAMLLLSISHAHARLALEYR